MRHFRDSLSAQRKIIRLKAIFQCPQNLRATCTKNGKTTSYRGEEMPKALFFHVDEKPDGLKKKNKTTAETPHGNTHKKAMRKDMAHPLSKRKLQKQKAAFCQIPDARESIICDRSRPGLQIRHSRQPGNDYLSF